MLMHPVLMLVVANTRRDDLIAEADKERLLASARRTKESRRARKASAVRGQPTGNLASCEPSAAVPAR